MRRELAALQQARSHMPRHRLQCFRQFMFSHQWAALKTYANGKRAPARRRADLRRRRLGRCVGASRNLPARKDHSPLWWPACHPIIQRKTQSTAGSPRRLGALKRNRVARRPPQRLVVLPSRKISGHAPTHGRSRRRRRSRVAEQAHVLAVGVGLQRGPLIENMNWRNIDNRLPRHVRSRLLERRQSRRISGSGQPPPVGRRRAILSTPCIARVVQPIGVLMPIVVK